MHSDLIQKISHCRSELVHVVLTHIHIFKTFECKCSACTFA